MPVQNGGKAGGKDLSHFLTREGGDGFVHASTRHILRQRHAQGQRGSAEQDQESERKKNARALAQRRPRRGCAGLPARFGMPCMM